MKNIPYDCKTCLSTNCDICWNSMSCQSFNQDTSNSFKTKIKDLFSKIFN